MKNVNRVLVSILIFGTPATLLASDNYFQCNTVKGTVSLKGTSEQLIYEMNNQYGNKFKYVSEGPNYTGFLYNHYTRFQTDYMSVSFVQGGYKYVIFSNYEDGKSMRGVNVIDIRSKKEYLYNCKDYTLDDLYYLEKKLQCDTNNALGCQ